MLPEPLVIEADLTWTGRRFEPELQVVVAGNGTIEHVGALGMRPTHRLHHRALIPGFVNAHSHAFQRGLRGRGESFPKGSGSFWTWREAMYELVTEMTPERMLELTRRAFREMLAAGMTTVGEFHYLHHTGAVVDFVLDEFIVQAARDVGIRLVLLNCYYRTGGIGRPLNDAQRRFDGVSVDRFWKQTDRLKKLLDPATQSLACAPHSIRAVSIEEIVELRAEAKRRGMPFHIHAEEVIGEIEDSVVHYRATPLQLLCERADVDETFTIIHATHSSEGDLRRFLSSDGRICLCPITEGNLGDGVANLPIIRSASGRQCFGTDSNVRICATEEMRWLEFLQRAAGTRRGVVVDAGGDAARALFEVATRGGAEALGLRAGQIEPGCLADFCAIDLTSPSLEGWTPETLLPAFLFGSGNDAIGAVCVGGKWHPGAHGRIPFAHDNALA